jgi:hypothetical protein
MLLPGWMGGDIRGFRRWVGRTEFGSEKSGEAGYRFSDALGVKERGSLPPE